MIKKNKKIIEIIKKTSNETKMKAYIVGGVVRDIILGGEIKDIDFLIEGSAIDFTKKADLKIKSIHETFNTVKVEILNTEIDIASTRIEKYPAPGCLPVVIETGVKIEDDLKRRDFTINSIAINLENNNLIDPFNGEGDIKSKKLKILHQKSFIDDPTRILRGLDFKYRFDFDFGENEKKLIKECTINYDNSQLSIDRIYLTLKKIFNSDNSDKILKDLLQNEIYKIWTQKIGIKINEITALYDAIKKFDAKKSDICLMALNDCPYLKAHLADDFEIYNFFKKFNLNQLAFYYFKTKDENALKYLKLKDIKPLMTGKILMENGFMEGEIIGIILNSILKEKILNPQKFNDINDELDFVLNNFKP